MTKNTDAADAARAAPEHASIVDVGDAEDELQALVEAAAEGEGAAVATAGTALFVKVLTGSSVAAGVAEKLAGRFGQWLADNPDTQLQAAAQAYARADAAQHEREAFLAQVRALLAFGLRSTDAALRRLEQGRRTA